MKNSLFRPSILFAVFLFIIGSQSVIFACTGFMVSDSESVFAAFNEDQGFKGKVEISFESGEDGKHGAVWFLYDDVYQNGMNDKGLFWDAFWTPFASADFTSSKDKPIYKNLPKNLEVCASVEEVLTRLSKYNLETMGSNQWWAVDKTGASAVIEGDAIIRKKGDFQVVSMFRRSKVGKESEPCEWYLIGCDRYEIAKEMLKKCNEFNINCLRDTLKAVSQDNIIMKTLYSAIFDLKNGLIYLYRQHDFSQVVVIDVKKELKKGKRRIELSTLFIKAE